MHLQKLNGISLNFYKFIYSAIKLNLVLGKKTEIKKNAQKVIKSVLKDSIVRLDLLKKVEIFLARRFLFYKFKYLVFK